MTFRFGARTVSSVGLSRLFAPFVDLRPISTIPPHGCGNKAIWIPRYIHIRAVRQFKLPHVIWFTSRPCAVLRSPSCIVWIGHTCRIIFVLLTVHPNIMIVFFLPTWCTNYLFWYIYYIPLHVSSTIVLIFRRTIVWTQYLVSSLSLGDRSVHRYSRNLRTEQSPEESDDTICCTNTIVLLKMRTVMLETCGGI